MKISLALGCLVMWIFASGDSLLNSDDVIYSQMARESLESGMFLEHTWMGVTLFEKPPLLLWLLQLSGAVFGFVDEAMRIPAAFGATLTLVYTFKLTRLVVPDETGYERWAWLSTGVLLATWTFTEAGSRVMTDTLLAAAIVAMCYYALRMESEGGRTWSVRLGIAAGLGFMAKSFAIGPTALIVLGFLIWRKRIKEGLFAVAVAACISFPWHAYMTIRYGIEFWDVYFGYHVLGRAGGIAVGHEGSDFFFLQWLSADPIVVFLLIPCALGAVIYGVRNHFEQVLLPLMVASLGLVVLHVSQTKFIHYAVPYIPPLVVTTGWLLCRTLAHRGAVQMMVIAILASSGFATQRGEHELARPELKRLAEKYIYPRSDEDLRLIVFNDYAPSFYFYGKREGELWTDSKRFYDIQQSVDMMKRSGRVRFASRENLASIRSETRPMLLMAPHARMNSPNDELSQNPMSSLLRSLMVHFRSENRPYSSVKEDNYLVVEVKAQP